MIGHQTAVDTLRKTAEALITSEGDLLSNPDEIQETVGKGKSNCTTEMILLILKYVLLCFEMFISPCDPNRETVFSIKHNLICFYVLQTT